MRGWRPSALPTCVPLFGFVKGRQDQPHSPPRHPAPLPHPRSTPPPSNLSPSTHGFEN
jgi:hypothetical protein